ncbi:MAG: hypothetical protein R6T98_15900 [Desulfatiglandales bacterium]
MLKRPTREPRPPARLRPGGDSGPEGTPPRKGGPTPRRELKKSPSSLGQEGLCKGLLE